MTATYRRQQGSKVYTFKSLADLMAKATPERSGDALAGVCAQISIPLKRIVMMGFEFGLMIN